MILTRKTIKRIISTCDTAVSDADVDDNSLGAANGYEFSGLAYIYVEDDTPDGTTFTVTCSAGVVMMPPGF